MDETLIADDWVQFKYHGPLGCAVVRGNRADWQRLRERARYEAGFRAEP
jgi:hypothetical protein